MAQAPQKSPMAGQPQPDLKRTGSQASGNDPSAQAAQETARGRAHDSARVNQPLPHVGKPLNGSQYHDVVEEQIYAEERAEQHPLPATQKAAEEALRETEQKHEPEQGKPAAH